MTARRILANLVALVGRDKVERDLDDESRRALGSVEAVKDRTRDAGWESTVDGCWRDVAHAFRSLRKAPSFAAVAVAILGLGIGANTAIFSVLNGLLLRPLPVHAPGELITVAAVGPAADDRAFSYSAYRRLAIDGRAVLSLTALLAGYLPARRAAAVDPAATLRSE